jgi:hypothetical protein
VLAPSNIAGFFMGVFAGASCLLQRDGSEEEKNSSICSGGGVELRE